MIKYVFVGLKIYVDTVDVFNKGEWSINEFPGWQ